MIVTIIRKKCPGPGVAISLRSGLPLYPPHYFTITTY